MNEMFHIYHYLRFEYDVLITDIIPLKDPRSRTLQILQARAHEIKNLIKRKHFKVMLKEEIPKDTNILPGRF